MACREPLARSALWLPLFDELSDPTVCARLAAEAEEVGWHGFFVWDQLRWEAPVRQVADSWITLAALAAATERLRLGPTVTGSFATTVKNTFRSSVTARNVFARHLPATNSRSLSTSGSPSA